MIRIERFSDWTQVDEMVEWFEVERAGQEQELAQQLKQALHGRPETVFVVQARRDGELIGFIVCDLAIGHPYVWMSQAWSHPQNTFRVADEMWRRVREWAEMVGKGEVRAETRRQVDALRRRFGFEVESVTISCDIRNQANGKPIQQTKDDESERVESGAAPVVGASGELSAAADRAGAAGD